MNVTGIRVDAAVYVIISKAVPVIGVIVLRASGVTIVAAKMGHRCVEALPL